MRRVAFGSPARAARVCATLLLSTPLLCTLLLSALLSSPSAFAGPPEASLGAIVGKTVRASYARLHACYRQSLAVDRSKGGTVFLEVTLRGDAVADAKVARDELGHAPTAACLRREVLAWRLAGAAATGVAAGAAIIVPLTFRGHPGQSGVALADVPAQRDASGALRRAWVTAANLGSRAVSLTCVESDGELISQALEPGLLLLWRGAARWSGRTLRAGAALWLPAGQRVRLVSKGGKVVLLRLTLARALGATGRLRSVRLPLRAGGVVVRRHRLHRGAKLALGETGRDVLVVLLAGRGELRQRGAEQALEPEQALFLRGGRHIASRGRRGPQRQLRAATALDVLLVELRAPR